MLLRIICFCYFFQFYEGYTLDIPEKIKELKKRTLIVAIEAPMKSNLMRLNADEEENYKKAIESYNRKIKEVVAKFWTFNQTVEFKNWEEIDAVLKQSKGRGYLLFFAANHSVDPSISQFIMQKGLRYSPDIFTQNDERSYRNYFTTYALCELENFRSNKLIVDRSLENIWPLKEDMIFACQYIQCLLYETERSNSAKNVSNVASFYNDRLMKSKLLLKSDLLKTADIKYAYPYQFEVVSHDTLLAKIFNKEMVTYVEIVPELVGTGEAYRRGYEHILVEASSGKIVGYVPVNSGVLHATAGHYASNKFIHEGILKNYLSASRFNKTGTTEPKE